MQKIGRNKIPAENLVIYNFVRKTQNVIVIILKMSATATVRRLTPVATVAATAT